MRYKVGDKVVIRKDTEFDGTDYSNQVATIIKIRTWEHLTDDYKVDLNAYWCIGDEDINHEATAKLNEVKPKQLLRSGMIVEYRCHERSLVVIGEDMPTKEYGNQSICFVSDDSFMNGSAYDNDLKLIDPQCETEYYDIVKIYKPDVYTIDKMVINCNESNLIWERPAEVKTIKMTLTEVATKLGLDENTKLEIEM